jgi:hypothetical protein
MGLVIGFAHPLTANVRVNLRARKTAMAEQFLNTADVGAAIEHVGGERMAQRVGAGGRCDTGSL